MLKLEDSLLEVCSKDKAKGVAKQPLASAGKIRY